MTTYTLSDWGRWIDFLPLAWTRPIGAFRCGILTLQEKWPHYMETECSFHTEPHLRELFPSVSAQEQVLVNATALPTAALAEQIKQLRPRQLLVASGRPVALHLNGQHPDEVDFSHLEAFEQVEHKGEVQFLEGPWSIFTYNGDQIKCDFELLTKGRQSAAPGPHCRLTRKEHIFIEEGATVEGCSLNASEGPIYIGKDAVVMEGALIRGPFALCEHSQVKMGAKMYGETTIGPWSKVAGEVQNSVLFGYSNKGHDGYLGNSVLGHWCNLGADTNTSNLKNTYQEVKIWSYRQKRFAGTGSIFCGLMMGDHSKCGINTMFNTGTVVGVSANIFGGGFPRTFIPSFSWGGSQGFTTYQVGKALDVARTVMARRKIELTEADEQMLKHVFEQTENFR